MELDEQGNPIIPEDLRNKPQTEWTPEDWDRSGGSGRAVEGPEMLAAAGLMIGGPKAAAAWGTGKVLETGLNLIAPDAEDTKLEQVLDFNKPLKTGVKGTRLLYENILKEVFDHRILDRPSSITRFSTLQKHKHNRDILDQYVHKKAVEGPHKNWQDQGIPQTELSSEISDLARKNDLQYKGDADPTGISSELRYGDRQIWENLPTKTQELFIELGIDSDKAVLLIKNSEGPISREALAAVEGGAFTDATFKFMSSELLPEFLEESKNIDLRGGIQLDHIAQLRAMIPFYEGRNLKQWPKIRRILVREGIFGGHNPKNLQYLNTPVHQIKTNFWIDQVGKDGSKFFKGRRMKTYAQVEAAAKDMKTIINRSNDIVEKLSAQYKLLNQGRDITPIELAAILEKVDLNFGKYNLKDFKKLVRLVNKQELDADTLKLMKGVELQGELDDYSSAVRQVIQDTDPAYLPKKPRVTKKDKGKKIEDIVPLTEEQQLNILDEFFDE